MYFIRFLLLFLIDSTNAPITGTSITVKSTNTTLYSDLEGRFMLQDINYTDTLKFELVSYSDTCIAVSDILKNSNVVKLW